MQFNRYTVCLFSSFFQYIYSYAFLEMPLRITTECLKLVTKITETNLGFLTKQSFMVKNFNSCC